MADYKCPCEVYDRRASRKDTAPVQQNGGDPYAAFHKQQREAFIAEWRGIFLADLQRLRAKEAACSVQSIDSIALEDR